MNCIICGDKTEEITQEIREGPVTLHQCYNCGLIHLPSDKDLKKFYAEEYRKEYGPSTDPKKVSNYQEIFDTYVKYQGQRIKALEPYLGKDKTLLDVGCSTGHFLWNVKDKLSGVWGIDWDAGAVEYARKYKGLTGVHTSFDDVLRHKFDIVYSSMTLEHAEDPFTFVNNLKSKLAPKGTIYIEVPNLNDALLSVYKNKEYKRFYFRKAHIWYYTPTSLRRLMEQAGFKGKIIFMQDYNLSNHLHWWQTNTPQPDCNDGLERRFTIEHLFTQYMYDELLCKQGISDNVAFIGTVK